MMGRSVKKLIAVALPLDAVNEAAMTQDTLNLIGKTKSMETPYDSQAHSNVLAIAIGLILTCCATTANYEKTLNSWKGSHVDSLVSAWGYPYAINQAPNGNKLLVYHRSNTVEMPQYGPNETATYKYNSYNNTVQEERYSHPKQTVTYYCTTYFEVDLNNSIVRWSYSGNNCVQ
ncbi:MAG: hypothetical protein IPJ88_15345 [Myxococcales bacterium]|nr:MAG: hypothetical protein IPJ88_15345 [Myxococcales bacterium]